MVIATASIRIFALFF